MRGDWQSGLGVGMVLGIVQACMTVMTVLTTVVQSHMHVDDICIYIYIYVHIYICIYIYIYTHVYIYIYLFIYL